MHAPAARTAFTCSAIALIAILVVTAGRVTHAATAVKIAAGSSHTCAITSDGGLKCWGDNTYGQLGDGTTADSSMPVDVSGLGNDVVAVAAGRDRTCALTSSAGVKCWGHNYFGELGDGSTTDRPMPVDVVGLTTGVSSISTSAGHICAVLSSGGVKCWGENYYGQLGDGTESVPRPTPLDVVGLGDAVAVAAGGSHTCALTGTGGVKCWGDNDYGQLGDGTWTSRPTPVDVSGLTSGVTAIALGDDHTCALTATGGVTCWGRLGFLGDGTGPPPKGPNSVTTPVDVFGLASGAVSLSAGSRHTCAATAAGLVKCWGLNLAGELGDGTTTWRYAPVDARNDTGAVGVAAGGAHTCIVTVDGAVQCWGDNSHGQVGAGVLMSTTPVDVQGLSSGVNAIAVGNWREFSCAATSSDLECWGSNGIFQLGDGTRTTRGTPGKVIGLDGGIRAVAAGAYHACALTNAGGIKCWGSNGEGQIGDGILYGDRLTPTDVSGLASGVVAIAAGLTHTCALTAGGGVKCWGHDGTSSSVHWVPTDVAGLGSGVIAITAGDFHSCALTAGGGVKCWGSNGFGEMGDGTTVGSLVPVDVAGLTSGVVGVTAGNQYTCAVTSAGSAMCWGRNLHGQLGDLTTIDREAPVEVVGLTDAVAISAGSFFTCAVTSAGAVKCWGDNGYGQLGDGTLIERHAPVDVVGLGVQVTALGSASDHTCALTIAGGVKCWGSNRLGQLGDGSWVSGMSPVTVPGFGPDGGVPRSLRPVIASVTPPIVRPGSGAFTLIVAGTNFVDGAVVLLNGSPRTTTFISGAELRAAVSAADIAAAGAVEIVVWTGSGPRSAPATLTVRVDVVDFNGDRAPDLLWRNPLNGEIVFWTLNGVTATSETRLEGPSVPNWTVVAVADFNQDGNADLLWYNPTTGQSAIWYMKGTSYTGSAWLEQMPNTNWQLATAADFNGDAQLDLVWRNTVTGQNMIWFMNGTAHTAVAPLQVMADLNWNIVGAGDFNGDGMPDLVWRNQATGENAIWLLDDGLQATSFRLNGLGPANEWVFSSVGDYNADGNTDIAWRNRATGQGLVWYMNGTTVTSSAALPTAPLLRSTRPSANGQVVGGAKLRNPRPFGPPSSSSQQPARSVAGGSERPGEAVTKKEKGPVRDPRSPDRSVSTPRRR